MRGSVATVDGIPVTTPEILNDSDDEIKDLKQPMPKNNKQRVQTATNKSKGGMTVSSMMLKSIENQSTREEPKGSKNSLQASSRRELRVRPVTAN